MRWARPLTGAALSTALAVATLVVFGSPNVGRSLSPWADPHSTPPSVGAVVGLLCWLGVAVLVLVTVADAAARLRRLQWPPWSRGVRSAMVLVVGLIVLAAAVTTVARGDRVCCGGPASVREVDGGAR